MLTVILYDDDILTIRIFIMKNDDTEKLALI